jgi:hypothetical protein
MVSDGFAIARSRRGRRLGRGMGGMSRLTEGSGMAYGPESAKASIRNCSLSAADDEQRRQSARAT